MSALPRLKVRQASNAKGHTHKKVKFMLYFDFRIELHWKLINGFPLIESGLSYLIDKHWLMDFAFDSYVQLMED